MGFWVFAWIVLAIAILLFSENKEMGYAALVIANVYVVGSLLERGRK